MASFSENQLDDMAEEALEIYHTKHGVMEEQYRMVCQTFTMGEIGSRYKKNVEIAGATHTAQGSTGAAPAADDIESGGTGYEAPVLHGKSTITDQQLRNNPRLLQQRAEEYRDGAWAGVAAVAFAAFATPDSTTHPNNGTALVTASGGGTAYLADVFDESGGLGYYHDNLLTAALDATTLAAAKQRMNEVQTPDGHPFMGANDPMVLMVPPALQQLGHDLIGRDKEIWDGAGNIEPSGAWGMQGGLLVNGFATDDTDWGIWSVTRNPWDFWLRLPPRVIITRATDGSGVFVIRSEYEAVMSYRREQGLVFSKVAG